MHVENDIVTIYEGADNSRLVIRSLIVHGSHKVEHALITRLDFWLVLNVVVIEKFARPLILPAVNDNLIEIEHRFQVSFFLHSVHVLPLFLSSFGISLYFYYHFRFRRIFLRQVTTNTCVIQACSRPGEVLMPPHPLVAL